MGRLFLKEKKKNCFFYSKSDHSSIQRGPFVVVTVYKVPFGSS